MGDDELGLRDEARVLAGSLDRNERIVLSMDDQHRPAIVRQHPTQRTLIRVEEVARVGDAERKPVERAELFWRLSVPISAFVLTLFAVPLAYVNPRIGRSFNLFIAAFMYMLYSNCLNIVQSMIARGAIDFWLGLVLPHLAALLVAFLLFRHQLSISGLFGPSS